MIKSVKNTFEHEIVISKSRFICILSHINSTDEVKDILELYKEIYPEANHYCYAYIFDEHMKASDDGEPAKTAGMPMLNVLQKQELNQVLAIVIRYFGGIKLGAGGLVRAYTQSVSQALQHTQIVSYVLKPKYKITFDYSFNRQIDYLIKTLNINILNKEYDEKITYTCFIDKEDFFVSIQDITSNQYSKEHICDEYVEENLNEKNN